MFATKWGATGICSRPMPGAVSCAGSVSAGALAAQGTRFEDCWTQYRDWPVTEYQLLVGGLPTFTAANAPAETDPAQLPAPGIGLLQMHVAPTYVATMP